ncbi:hypothetical protein FA95DRAFT_1684904, partial [Auriscalpium vulgare]
MWMGTTTTSTVPQATEILRNIDTIARRAQPAARSHTALLSLAVPGRRVRVQCHREGGRGQCMTDMADNTRLPRDLDAARGGRDEQRSITNTLCSPHRLRCQICSASPALPKPRRLRVACSAKTVRPRCLRCTCRPSSRAISQGSSSRPRHCARQLVQGTVNQEVDAPSSALNPLTSSTDACPQCCA